jgi:ATP-dependent HslUV protease, peptidase subunit HslV
LANSDRGGANSEVCRCEQGADFDIFRRSGKHQGIAGRKTGPALAARIQLAYISVFRLPAKGRMDQSGETIWHGTTILCVRKSGQVVVAGDGQVSMGQTVVKSNARKLRRLAGGSVIAGFAGTTADAITLFERLEAKLEQYAAQLPRACVELAKDWRTDRYLRRLEAMMAVADKNVSLIMSGNGDVLEPEDGIIGIGSGGGYALAAARALIGIDGIDAVEVAQRAMAIAAGICIYTNDKITLEKLEY